MLFPRLDASFARIGQLSARSTARSGHGRKHVKAGPRRPRRAPSLDAGAWRATVIAPRGNDVIGRGRDRPKKSTDNRRSGVSRNPCHHLVESRYPPPPNVNRLDGHFQTYTTRYHAKPSTAEHSTLASVSHAKSWASLVTQTLKGR